MQALEGECIEGQPVRIQYCIPGVHAINIYMSFVNNPMDAVAERKALLDETPSSKVYDQMNSLAKHNPWFVANLQKIMATSNSKSTVPIVHSGSNSNNAAADPAQAALILLLAGKVAQGPPDQMTNLVHCIVKQMSNGMNATEILRGIIKPSGNEDLIQAAIKMASDSSQSQAQNHKELQGKDKNCCPLLMELLYKSFQARLAKEQRLKALEQEHKSSLKPAPTASNFLQPQPHQSPATVAISHHQQQQTQNQMDFNQATNEMLLNLQNQASQVQPAPQPQLASTASAAATYPALFYMNPFWAAAQNSLNYPFLQAQTQTTATSTPPQQTHQVVMQFPYNHATAMMAHAAQAAQHHATSQHIAGIKRTAAPVIYPNAALDKRMKLA